MNVSIGNIFYTQPSTASVNVLKIDCPFDEKEAVKKLGARWSAVHKTWYAPSSGVFLNLKKWHPKENHTDVKREPPPPPQPSSPVKRSRSAEAVVQTKEIKPPLKSKKQKVQEKKPWECTGETESDYRDRQACGSYYKGILGGVPDPEQYMRMKAGFPMAFIDTRGD
jgi:hypothetical protein